MTGVMYYELVVERRTAGSHEPVEHEIIEVAVFYGVPTMLLTVFGGWWLLRRALKPLDDLTRAAEQLQVHNLREPLPRTGNGDEVDRLSEVLNSANRRLEDAFKQIKEFTLNASHELKTPLAILHGEIETALSNPAATPAQREMYASQLDEIQRLTKIVESLTFLAKADTGLISLTEEPVRLGQLLQNSFEDTQILATQNEIVVELTACEEIVVQGDRHRLRQLLLNLADNAIKYNQKGGRVWMSLRRNGGKAELTIINTGKGIPAALLTRIFERFFRVDQARNSEIEGSGLGLAIVLWIVKSHRGEIQIQSELDKTTTVTVTLPLSHTT